MSTGQWYWGDFHAHTTVSSDGKLSPTEFTKNAQQLGLDFVSITDHNELGGWELVEGEFDIMTFPGIEVTLYEGHYNVFPVRRNASGEWPGWLQNLRDTYVKDGDNEAIVNETMQAALDCGLLNSINHPNLPPWAWEFSQTDLRLVHCVELFNDPSWPGQEDYPNNMVATQDAVAMWSRWLNAGYRITAIGGSDYHGPADEPAGYTPTIAKPATYVWAPELSVDAIAHSLRTHRAYITMVGQVTFTASAEHAQFEIGQDMGDYKGELQISASVSGLPEESVVELICPSGILHAIRGSGTVELNHTLRIDDPNELNWLRIDARGADGRYLVVTNPIYGGRKVKPTNVRYGDYLE